MKKILFVGAEAMPFAATGGLGDVLGSLPAAIRKKGGKDADVRVVLPLYGAMGQVWREQLKDEAEFRVNLAWRNQFCGVKSLVKDGVTFYFIENEYYFNRPSLYGNFDDGERYAFFCKAIDLTVPNPSDQHRQQQKANSDLHPDPVLPPIKPLFCNQPTRFIDGIRPTFRIKFFVPFFRFFSPIPTILTKGQ